MNKLDFLNNVSRKTSTITVEGLGEVNCRELSAGAISSIKELQGDMNILAKIIIAGVMNDEGKPSFTDKDKGSILELPLAPLTAVSEEIMSLTGLVGGDVEAEEVPNA